MLNVFRFVVFWSCFYCNLNAAFKPFLTLPTDSFKSLNNHYILNYSSGIVEQFTFLSNHSKR